MRSIIVPLELTVRLVHLGESDGENSSLTVWLKNLWQQS